jgi:hypothetical protein
MRLWIKPRVSLSKKAEPTLRYIYVSSQWPRDKFFEQTGFKKRGIHGYTPSMAAQMGCRAEVSRRSSAEASPWTSPRAWSIARSSCIKS